MAAKATFSYMPVQVGATAGHPEQSTIYRPHVAGSILARNGRTLRWLFLADTGADNCLLPLAVTSLLGIDVHELAQASMGALGRETHVGYYDSLTIGLGQGIAFQATVGFTCALDTVGFGLLGNAGFFDHYDVEFRHRERAFTVHSG